MSKGVIPVAAVLCAIAVAGCGSSSKSSSTQSLAAFKTAFAAQRSQFKGLGQDLASAIRTAGSKGNTDLASEFNSLSSKATQAAGKNDAAGAKSSTEKLIKDAAAVKSADDGLAKALGLPASG
jgi:hypothetical protein